MQFLACAMTKLPGKLLQTDSMWDAGTAIMAQAANKQELISKQTALAVQSAFHALDQAILIHNAWTLDDLVPLKGMVCEMIRPMLKAWLDDKLPAMVERLVRTEIERRRS